MALEKEKEQRRKQGVTTEAEELFNALGRMYVYVAHPQKAPCVAALLSLLSSSSSIQLRRIKLTMPTAGSQCAGLGRKWSSMETSSLTPHSAQKTVKRRKAARRGWRASKKSSRTSVASMPSASARRGTYSHRAREDSTLQGAGNAGERVCDADAAELAALPLPLVGRRCRQNLPQGVKITGLHCKSRTSSNIQKVVRRIFCWVFPLLLFSLSCKQARTIALLCIAMSFCSLCYRIENLSTRNSKRRCTYAIKQNADAKIARWKLGNFSISFRIP